MEGVQNSWELLAIELDYSRLLARPNFSPDSKGAHTVNDGTNDLVNLAILGGGSRCKTLGDDWGKSLWLESTLEGWSAERRGAQRPRDAAVTGSVSIAMASMESSNASSGCDVLLQHLCECEMRCW